MRCGYEGVVTCGDHCESMPLHKKACYDMKVAQHLITATPSNKSNYVVVDVSDQEIHASPLL